MYRSLAAAVLLAASALPSQAEQPFRWSGAYLGAHLGYAWGNVDVTDTTGGVAPGPFSYDPKGAFGGVTAGYNWQFGAVVAGIEGDFGYMDLKGSGIIPSSTPPNHQDIELKGGLYGVAAGRLGLAWDRTLIYGKGGAAYFGGEASQTTTKPGYLTTPTGAFTGWAYGGGIEHFFTPGVSVKVEFLRFDFRTQGGMQTAIDDPPNGFHYLNKHDLTADTVKVGFNVHF